MTLYYLLTFFLSSVCYLLYISRGTSYVISYHFYLEETWKVAFKLRPEKSHVSVDTVRVDIKKSKKDIRKYMPEAEQ